MIWLVMKMMMMWNDDAKTINKHIAQAFKAAESTRMIIIEQQQLNKLTESINTNEKFKDSIDMVTQKAVYLLKISRSNKIPSKNELYSDNEDGDKCNLIVK
jgi:hypothetical protein